MVGIDLGDHDPALRMGHRVTLAARERGAIVRPLGDTVVLVPPLSISAEDLRRLLDDHSPTSIEAACAPVGRAAIPLATLGASLRRLNQIHGRYLCDERAPES